MEVEVTDIEQDDTDGMLKTIDKQVIGLALAINRMSAERLRECDIEVGYALMQHDAVKRAFNLVE